MDIGLECPSCGSTIEYVTEDPEPNTTIPCDCGALYAVTVSIVRR
ncbi:hypothetical protein [Halopenitus malekzadehii]|nr:hypothetical protein [Halopenitus malekzadehii]